MIGSAYHVQVALRKESVDRNRQREIVKLVKAVALRKESVDRNFDSFFILMADSASLSARRAWIEICRSWPKQSNHRKVALRKESVDRNA